MPLRDRFEKLVLGVVQGIPDHAEADGRNLRELVAEVRGRLGTGWCALHHSMAMCSHALWLWAVLRGPPARAHAAVGAASRRSVPEAQGGGCAVCAEQAGLER